MGNEIWKLEDYQPYVAAVEKLRELKAEQAEVWRQITETLHRMRARQAVTTTLREQAEALLDAGTTELPDRASPQADQDQLGNLYQRFALLSEIVQVQAGRVEQARVEASKAICKTYAPAWSGMVQTIRDCARKLAEVGQQEHDLRDDLRRQGVYITAPLSDAAGCSDSLLWKLNQLTKEADEVL
jgi:uncharacterized protein YutE (UPF0331/DUF86 family)